MKKSIRITKANKADLWALSDARFAYEKVHINEGKTRPSTGADCKARERDIRDMLNVDGITYSGDLRARGANRDDIFTRDRHGNKIVIEVKHGGGALAYACNYDFEIFETRTPDLCLQGVDYVVYNVTASLTKRTKMALEYRVSTRADFLDMLEEYCHGKRSGGFETATKFSKGGAQINIQSQYLTQFWDGLRNDSRSMCLWDFCTKVLGRDPRWER